MVNKVDQGWRKYHSKHDNCFKFSWMSFINSKILLGYLAREPAMPLIPRIPPKIRK